MWRLSESGDVSDYRSEAFRGPGRCAGGPRYHNPCVVNYALSELLFPSACIPFLAWRCGDAFIWPHFSIEWETWGSTSLPRTPHGHTGHPSQRCSTAPTGLKTILTYAAGCHISASTRVPNVPQSCEFYLFVLPVFGTGDSGTLPRVGVPWLPCPFLLVATCRFLSSKCRLSDTCTVC